MIKKSLLLLLLSPWVVEPAEIQGQEQPVPDDPLAHTFSIIARDPETGEMAVGVQSHWFSVGTIVSWGSSGVGVVATQSFVNPAYGPLGLELMREGVAAPRALEQLLATDDGRDFRQVAFLDNEGRVASYTGSKCIIHASHETGDQFSVQANMMLNGEVVPAMKKAYLESKDLPLADRVLAAMMAAQEQGGDIRGKQSAVLIVVGPERTGEPWLDKKIDLRVDDHPEPLLELQRLLLVHHAYDHMNRGDLAVEHNDMELALEEYGAAEALFPENLEMKFWKAVTLANNGRLDEALPIFKEVFTGDNNWRELVRRLPAPGLITLSPDALQKITDL